ncbi:MAG: ribonuclease PH [Spirochaetes bacterium]|nr:ribonuclease PH [Spirochaetota bacterium]
MSYLRKNNRKLDEIRKVIVTPNFCPASLGSVLYQCGNTQVICAVSITPQVPQHALDKGTGWITAEYSLLPYATNPRTERRNIRPDGRSVEIQRLIGRSLRTILDLEKMQGVSLIVDCDVLQADGGTRTAAISGAYIALQLAIKRLLHQNYITDNPIKAQVAAISIGYIGNDLLLDLDYEEDSQCDVDMNLVMDSKNNIIEIQGTGEKRSFSNSELESMLRLAQDGIQKIFAIQNDVLKLYL